MKKLKIIIWSVVLFCLAAGVFSSCTQGSHPCATYQGSYSNFHVKYKHRNF